MDDTGEAVGIAADYWRLIGERLGVGIEFFPVQFADQLDGLKAGTYDSLQGIFPLESRKEWFAFSPTYLEIPTRIFTTAADAAAVTSLDSLSGMKVAVVDGDSGQQIADDAGLETLVVPGYPDAVKAVAEGTAGATILDELVGVYYINQFGYDDEVGPAGPAVDEGQMTLPVQKDDTILLGILTKAQQSDQRPGDRRHRRDNGWRLNEDPRRRARRHRHRLRLGVHGRSARGDAPGAAGARGAGRPLLHRHPGHAPRPAALAQGHLPSHGHGGRLAETTRFDFVLVPVKHYQLVDTVRELKEALPDGRFVLMAANWEGLAGVDAVLPREQYLWVYPASTGGHDEDLLVFNLSPQYRSGPIDGERPPWARQVEDFLDSVDMKPDRKPDMREWLWLHFAQAAGTIGSVIAAGGLQSFYEDEVGLRDRMVPAVRECLAVLAARGVDPAAYPEVAPYLTMPAEQVAAATKATASTPWVQRTLQAGHFLENAAEMRRFYLDVLATGEELGVPMPVMQSFREKVLASG